ncbi:hypothetical protein H072_1521 [Dactylellina haptotyla CBS 200.50]|uniref:PIG-P domain-containing protein n=1 Tax=Dactylellina haptotyla (strain CBS 200.50) TaxID=1284197 RepID=S8AU46_DACHA|nr:hypothetical protein H072_1521 [Dactylellina haptotyla CBS 200.50]
MPNNPLNSAEDRSRSWTSLTTGGPGFRSRSPFSKVFSGSRSRSSSISSDSTSSSQDSPSPSESPMAQTLLPPFYNRPPTPLPPSPSLTSLLRPPFTPSRPATPDSSDSEAANSSRIAQSTPRSAPKVPTYEYYGFVLYLTSTLAFITYLLWSYLPAPVLHFLGIHYFYNRWWSLAVPAYIVAMIIYIYVALASYNTEYLTPPLTSLENIVDEVAKMAIVEIDESKHRKIIRGINIQANEYDNDTGLPTPARSRRPSSSATYEQKTWESIEDVVDRHVQLDGGLTSPSTGPENCSRVEKVGRSISRRKKKRKGKVVSKEPEYEFTVAAQEQTDYDDGMMDWKDYWSTGTDAVMDIPIGGVCEVLYGEGRDDSDPLTLDPYY